ncbi:MAG TPA: hypothetical protein VFY73_11065 [Ideonella sp.]|uniref:hypothetical protein n=1 Tax=Ideonella sp. TaxID=1929293 RepID=UPI002E360664|nr:hypothetical protein [Ideonella sp.]HEX5684561.1 hypothetical protein [Ideonella sp.]
MTCIARTLLVAAFATGALCNTFDASAALPLRSVGVTARVPNTETARVGGVFYTARFRIGYYGGPLLLSNSEDGSGPTIVDDFVTISVTHPDGGVAVFTHDYSNGCTFMAPLPSQDISSYFQPGTNRVVVTLSDACGGWIGSDAIWLVTSN